MSAKKCFRGRSSRDYFSALSTELHNEIKRLSDSELKNTERASWIEYYYDKYYIAPVRISQDGFELSVCESEVKEYNHWARQIPYEPEYFVRDGYKIACKVAFTGDAKLFDLQPSRYTLAAFLVDSIETSRFEDQSFLVLSLSVQQSKADAESIQKHFESTINSFQNEIEPNNSDANNWNSQLEDTIGVWLDERTARLDSLNALKKSLCIPLQAKGDAPIQQIPLKKKRLAKPKASKSQEPSYAISSQDYENIIRIIDAQCSTFETAPAAYATLDEERLRDVILAMLNSHYEEGATGETFRRKGKTDINILFDNHAAFVAECKIWHGKAGLSKAIDQLFSYLTWRDTKVSLVIFNKKNRDFISILNTIDETLKERPGRVSKTDKNFWRVKETSPDCETSVELSVQVYNLYSG